MIYCITQKDDPQLSLLYKLANKNKIPCEVINVTTHGMRLSISPGRVLINNKVPEKGSLFYFHNIRYEFPHIPEEPINPDWTIFQDFHAAQQQQKSHIYSLMSILSNDSNYKVVNDFHQIQKLVSKYYILELLSDGGLDIPDYILTNSYQKLYDNPIIKNTDDIIWSYPESGSPVRKINKNRLNELLKMSNHVPYIFFEEKKGYAARVIFFEKYPLIITLIDKPSTLKYEERLEKYHHVKPHESLQKLGEQLTNLLGLSIYEIHGVIDDEDKFWFYDVTSYLKINSYSQKMQEYILSKLLERLCEKNGINISTDAPFIENEIRNTLFLKRMLGPLFEIQHKTE